jgi:hypothetical protein
MGIISVWLESSFLHGVHYFMGVMTITIHATCNPCSLRTLRIAQFHSQGRTDYTCWAASRESFISGVVMVVVVSLVYSLYFLYVGVSMTKA